MDKKKALELLNKYYYFAPVWLLAEHFLFPGFRAGAVVGQGFLPQAAFYGVEAAIGAAYWYKLPLANPAALAQNVACLVFYFKFIVFGPMDAAQALIDGLPGAEQMGRHYAAALPGAIFSAAQVVARIKLQLDGSGRAG